MSRSAAFTSEIIRTSTRGLAGMAAARLYESVADATTRYGEHGFDSWRQAIAARLSSLASALDVGDPALFAEDIGWFRSVSAAREIPEADLGIALDAIGHTVRELLPDENGALLDPYFDAARRAIEEGTDLPPEFAPGGDAAEFFELALLGDLGGAREFIVRGIRSGRFSVSEAIADVILPAAREAGRRWHLGQFGVAAEHVVTSTLRSALHAVTAVMDRPTPNGKAAFVAAVPGDAHDTALLGFALLLEQDGWRVALSGADTPMEESDPTALGYECDLIALSATMNSQRHAMAECFANRSSGVPVLVGGAAVRDSADARTLGADGFAGNLADGLAQARALVGLAPRA